MTKLNCTVTSCRYNDNEAKRCSLDSIKVEGTTAEISDGTACASFAEKKDNMTNSCGCRPKTSLSIECMAEKCIYNSDCKCTAAHIDVAGDGACDFGETRCATFTCENCR